MHKHRCTKGHKTSKKSDHRGGGVSASLPLVRIRFGTLAAQSRRHGRGQIRARFPARTRPGTHWFIQPVRPRKALGTKGCERYCAVVVPHSTSKAAAKGVADSQGSKVGRGKTGSPAVRARADQTGTGPNRPSPPQAPRDSPPPYLTMREPPSRVQHASRVHAAGPAGGSPTGKERDRRQD